MIQDKTLAANNRCCAVHLLSEHPDYREQRPALEGIVFSHRHIFDTYNIQSSLKLIKLIFPLLHFNKHIVIFYSFSFDKENGMLKNNNMQGISMSSHFPLCWLYNTCLTKWPTEVLCYLAKHVRSCWTYIMISIQSSFAPDWLYRWRAAYNITYFMRDSCNDSEYNEKNKRISSLVTDRIDIELQCSTHMESYAITSFGHT